LQLPFLPHIPAKYAGLYGVPRFVLWPGFVTQTASGFRCSELKIDCMAEQQATLASVQGAALAAPDWRLRRHADYQRVYQASRKHFSPSMSYFYALRTSPEAVGGMKQPVLPHGPRVGLTAGKVLGKAVDRNRIKRRMRAVVRRNIHKLTADVDVVLHPRKFVITLEYAKLESEVGQIFAKVQSMLDKQAGRPS
jgi:ribonuclease P protein component